LKSLYRTDSYATKKTTYFALYKLRSDQFKDLYTYLAKFKEYTNKLLQIGSPLEIDFQIAVFERGLLDDIKEAVYTLTKIARSRKEPQDFKYITTLLVNRFMPLKTKESKAFAGNFGKQLKQG